MRTINVEELVTKFTADVSEYRKRISDVTKDLDSLSGVTREVKELTHNALNSASGEMQKTGKQLQSLTDKQNKLKMSGVESQKRAEDYKEKVRLLVLQLNEQKARIRECSEELKKLNSQYKAQQEFLGDYDGGIEGVRTFRKQITDTIHNASAASDELRQKLQTLSDIGIGENDSSFAELKKQLADYSQQLQRAKNDLSVFDSELKEVGLNPDNLKADTLSSLSSKMQSLNKEKRLLGEASEKTGAQIRSLSQSAEIEKLKFNSTVEAIKQNKTEITKLTAKAKALSKTTAADKLKSGFNGLKNVLKKVGSTAGSAFFKVKNAVSKVKGATAGTNQALLGTVKSIKKIGIASLGLKVCKAVFGELRSIITNYLSQNEELNSRVEALKNAFANALAPAINAVISLFERLIPYALSVANAISGIFSSLGIASSIKDTSSAIKDTADATDDLSESQKDLYGFDKITKVSDNSSKNKSSSSKSDYETPVASSKFSKYLEDIKKLWKSGDFEGIGEKIADSCNKVISKIKNLDWKGIQSKVNHTMSGIARSLNGFVKDYDWQGAGEIVGNGINTIFGAIDSFLSNFDFRKLGAGFAKNFNGIFKTVDFKKIGKTISDAVSGAFDFIGGFLEELDWSQLARDLEALIAGIDFGKVATSLFRGLGAACGGITAFVGQIIVDGLRGIGDYFSEQIEACGGDVSEGIKKGITDGFKAIGKWINENILKPFTEGFKKAFQIHSPSRVMQNLGGLLMDGLKKGITDSKDKLKNKWQEVKGWFTNIKKNVSLSVKTKWSDLKSKWNNLLDKFKNKTVTISAKIGVVKDGIKEWLNNYLIEPINAKISWTGISIPYLAKGAVIDKPTVAMVGENGKEAVMPLENNTGWIKNLALQLFQFMGGVNSNNPVNITIPVEIGGKNLTPIVLDDVTSVSKRVRNTAVKV